MSTGLPARRAALRALAAVGDHGAWSNLSVGDAVAELADARDRALASHLAYDTLRWEGTLDWALGHHLRRELDEVEAGLRRVLRLGALQLLRTSVPPRAVVDTAVSLAREVVPAARARGAAGFVNGVLRSLSRGLDALPWPDADDDPIGHLALTTGHPAWQVVDLSSRLGATRAAAVLAADNVPPGVTLRAITDRDALVAELREQGVEARPGPLPESVRTPGADPRRLPAVAEGRAAVQDEASMHVVRATGAGSGDRVLDLCAGPGGKSTALAARVGAGGRVVAVERHPHRARLVARAAAAQGVEVEVVVGDAGDPPLSPGTVFDAVLLDAPCTGLGVGRRRPEVRWARREPDVDALAAVQRRLLAAAAARVAPGGRLTYSVCTWTTAETDEVAAWLDDRAADGLRPGRRRQLLPDTDGTDGMFVASWVRDPGGHVAADR